VAVGGVATVPWRLTAVEAALRGAPATPAAFEAAASVAADGARPLAANEFKVPLLKRTVVRALLELTEGSR
jgi:xanthine dehydrogenase YagS FAD-binding subunit